MRDVIIIGGGASALIAALFLSRSDIDVEIIEKNSSIGKKILASGNGKCNIINTTASIENYYGANKEFVKYAIKELSFNYFNSIINSIGLTLDIRDDGKCYPYSNEAKSVTEAFKVALTNTTITTDTTVLSIKHKDNIFFIDTTNGAKKSKYLIIATGSEAAPQLGGCSDGYSFATSFGHKIIAIYPALVQFETNHKHLSKLSGAKTTANVTLFIDNNHITTVSGDLLFTNYGLSGLTILDISTLASEALKSGKKVSISIELLPHFNSDELENLILKLCENSSIDIVLSGLLPSKIAHILLLDIDKTINKKTIKKLVYNLKNWKFDIDNTHGFKHAEVSGGGVDTTQIDNKTMESKLVKNLYFTGEVLDIVGDRGGYNFYFAWASGILAAKNIIKSIYAVKNL